MLLFNVCTKNSVKCLPFLVKFIKCAKSQQSRFLYVFLLAKAKDAPNATEIINNAFKYFGVRRFAGSEEQLRCTCYVNASADMLTRCSLRYIQAIFDVGYWLL